MNFFRRNRLFIMVCAVVLVPLIWLVAFGSTSTTKDAVYRQEYGSSATTTVITSDMNDTTVSIGIIQGRLTGITIKGTGTDTAFKVYVKDENSFKVFSKENCSTSSMPYRYALSTADTADNDFLGVPVSGTVSIQIADANNATLTDLTVKVYYDETIR